MFDTRLRQLKTFFSGLRHGKSAARWTKPNFLVILLIVAAAVMLLGVRDFSNPAEAVQISIAAPGAPIRTYDVVVYGGTPSGIMAAIAASRQGLRVALVNPDAHLGGVVTGGLCSSDVGDASVIGGLAGEFFKSVGRYYGKADPVYSFEPHAAEIVFDEMAVSAKIDIFDNHRLRSDQGVQKQGATIVAMATEDGSVFSAKEFVDSSYEGDLMAAAKVSYTVGRESRDTYNESLAGVRPYDIQHNFRYMTPAFNVAGNLMKEIFITDLPPVGAGDNKIPAYNYRLCLTYDPTNRLPFKRPDNYDPSKYEVLLKWLYVLKQTESNRPLRITDVLSMCKLPNKKFDANNAGPFSSDEIGSSWAYPDASYDERAVITEQHMDYLQGLLYFLTNDTRVPKELHTDMQAWGLAKDEFTGNGNWPYQLYIREARRMIGDFVMTQADLTTDRKKTDTIGMGSYAIDSHSVERLLTDDGYVNNEGWLLETVKPYEIPYRSIVPKAADAGNLFVTVCVSASHVAYSSIRMEPQYMIMGQAAGLAAKLAIDENTPVQKIDVAALQSLLKNQGAVLSKD